MPLLFKKLERGDFITKDKNKSNEKIALRNFIFDFKDFYVLPSIKEYFTSDNNYYLFNKNLTKTYLFKKSNFSKIEKNLFLYKMSTIFFENYKKNSTHYDSILKEIPLLYDYIKKDYINLHRNISIINYPFDKNIKFILLKSPVLVDKLKELGYKFNGNMIKSYDLKSYYGYSNVFISIDKNIFIISKEINKLFNFNTKNKNIKLTVAPINEYFLNKIDLTLKAGEWQEKLKQESKLFANNT